MSEIEQFIKQIPPATRYYLGSVIVTTFLVTYPIINVVEYMILDFSMVFKLQIWRLITNFFIVGKFSFGFLFFVMMTYQVMLAFENKAREQRKYSEFAMMLFYICSTLLLINLIFQFKVFLSMELLFALIYLDSKRDPDKPVALWGIKMKSKFLSNYFIYNVILLIIFRCLFAFCFSMF